MPFSLAMPSFSLTMPLFSLTTLPFSLTMLTPIPHNIQKLSDMQHQHLLLPNVADTPQTCHIYTVCPPMMIRNHQDT